MHNHLRALIVEDSSLDADLMIFELERAGFELQWQRVETEDDYLRCLYEDPEVILSDSSLPEFDGLRALDLLQKSGLDIPFLLVSGRLGEEFAVNAMKRGAHDYLHKDRLARLGEAVKRALEQRRLRVEVARAAEALRRSEEHYRLISDVTSDYAYSLRAGESDQLICEWATDSFARLTGYSLEEINARGWNSLYHPDDIPIVKSLRETLLSGQLHVIEVRTVTKGGAVGWARIYNRQIPGGEHGPRIYGAAQDITANRLLEQQLLHSQKMEAVGRLAGGVAHDFNNLLTVISGYGELLKEGFMQGNPSVDDLEPILHAAVRSAQLTGQLLAFSRRQVFQLGPVDLNIVVGDTEKMLRRVIGEHIDLQTVLDSQLGIVQADASQIEQIIVNLAVNARDAMPDGGRITIETANVELDEADVQQHANVRAGSYVMLAVRDTGIGMDKETQARIFEPFFTTKDIGKGTGLGLATVYGIVQQSGGSIRVDSELGRGTTFKVYLPKRDREVPAQAATSNGPVARGSETILVVEDETAVRKLVCQVLTSHGYRILDAGEVNEAIRFSREHRGSIALLLTDIVMPKMSGTDLAKDVVLLHPKIKVLYTSGYTDNPVVHHGMFPAGVAFFPKPFTPESLARKVREVLDMQGSA